MFLSSVVLYLLVRKSALLKTPSQWNNLAMFAIPVVVYVLVAGATHTNLTVNLYQLFIITILAIFFSYLGNVFSLRSIEYAPNPGYSLILSKSYVVFTTLASLVVFQSTLTVKAALAIVLIIGASALVMINKKTQDRSHIRPSWLPLAIGAFFCWGMLALTSKYLLIIGVSVMSRLIYSMIIVTILIIGEMKWKKVQWKALSSHQLIILGLIGIAASGFNYFMQEGFNTAPNIGYINAVNASSIAAVSFFSAMVFRDELTKRKVLGIVGVTVGLILLLL